MLLGNYFIAFAHGGNSCLAVMYGDGGFANKRVFVGHFICFRAADDTKGNCADGSGTLS